MNATVIDEYILPVLTRCIERYEWGWNLTKRVMNKYYGTDYTEKELKLLYERNKVNK